MLSACHWLKVLPCCGALALIDRILISDDIGQTRIALLDGPELKELHLIGTANTFQIGNIFLARVERVMSGLNAAFVDIGDSRSAFLRATEAQCLVPANKRDGRVKPIQACVNEGQSILVAITKEGTEGKGPRVTADPTIAGRYMVLTPLSDRVSISRKIPDTQKRDELHSVASRLAREIGCGLIVRTAAEDATEAALSDDAESLKVLWQSIDDQRTSASPPACLRSGEGGIVSLLREFVTSDIIGIEVDRAEMLATVRQATGVDMAKHVSLTKGAVSIFAAHGILDDIAQATERDVNLPGGGSISIDHTETMTVIDVNSGGMSDRASYETMALQTNLAAVEIVAQQLRLRGIGGLIAIDLLQMNEPAHVTEVEKALAAATSDDPAAVDAAPMSRFGVIEMTRQRLRDPLGITGSEACHHCAGTGRQASLPEIAYDVMRSAARQAKVEPGTEISVILSSELADWFDAEGAPLTEEFARRYPSRLHIDRNVSFDRSQYRIA